MEGVIRDLEACLDPDQLVRDHELMAPYLRECGGRETGDAIAVARPSSAAQVAALVRVCAANRLAVIPQGGNTGLTGSSLPRDADRHLLISLRRMNAIRSFDPRNAVIVAEAGCILSILQDHVSASQLSLPLGLGSEGSCTVGGITSTNAGGFRALRYGNARENILGVEVVLPDGTIFHGLRALRKHNAGYDLKQLFIGSEGTLGIITAVAMRLSPAWGSIEAAFVALPSVNAGMDLLCEFRQRFGETLVAFEFLDRPALGLATSVLSDLAPPVPTEHDAYALIEFAVPAGGGLAREGLANALEGALQRGMLLDAAIATSEQQRHHFWRYREAIVEGQRVAGASVKLDVSVPLGEIAQFIISARAKAAEICPGSRPICFGHIGDGNIHLSILEPKAGPRELFLEKAGALTRGAHDVALSFGGSISAEHGIGFYKRVEFERVVTPVELNLMIRIKHAIDPNGLMNPGVLLSDAETVGARPQ